MEKRKPAARAADASPLLEPRPEPESPEESAAYQAEAERRRWEENRPPHHEDR